MPLVALVTCCMCGAEDFQARVAMCYSLQRKGRQQRAIPQWMWCRVVKSTECGDAQALMDSCTCLEHTLDHPADGPMFAKIYTRYAQLARGDEPEATIAEV